MLTFTIVLISFGNKKNFNFKSIYLLKRVLSIFHWDQANAKNICLQENNKKHLFGYVKSQFPSHPIVRFWVMRVYIVN